MRTLVRKYGFLFIIVGLSLVHWLILWFQLPVFTQLKDWFWQFTPKLNVSIESALFLIFLATIIICLLSIKNKYIVKLLLLIIIGTSLQFGFASLEGRGINAITDRIITSGHAEFAREAVKKDNIYFVLSNYDNLLKEKELGLFPNSKPPGTFFFYMLSSKIANLKMFDFVFNESDNDLKRLELFATYTWPFIANLILIPIFILTSSLFDKKTAIVASTLYITIPSFNLITLHTDQVLFPVLFTITLMIGVLAIKKVNWIYAVITGMILYISIWFSFALVFTIPFILGFLLSEYPYKNNGQLLSKELLKIALLMPIGVIISDIIFRLSFDYDILHRYKYAMYFHSSWKKWEGGIDNIFYYGGVNILEFALWIGIPISILYLKSLYSFFYKTFYNNWIEIFQEIYPIILLLVFIALILFGKTKGEVARLWLFIVPYICIIVAHNLSKDKSYLVKIIVLLQFGTVTLTKISQDFW